MTDSAANQVRAIHEALGYLAADAREAGAEDLFYHLCLSMHAAREYLAERGRSGSNGGSPASE